MKWPARVIAAAATLLLAGCAGPDPSEMFAAGRYEEARREYLQALERDPGSPAVHYDIGATALRLREYGAARPHLQLAATTGSLAIRQSAFYNLGNAHLEPALLDLVEDRPAELARAIVAYKRALLLDPRDQDAKWNLELARRLLERELSSPRPRDDPREGGGGGAGGGGGSDTRPGSADPSPQSAAGSGRAPDISRTEAEQVLDAAETRELGLQRAKLARPQPARVSH